MQFAPDMQWLQSESGQAAVETALTMPLVVFFALGTLQLAAMQQARLLTEYAAFQAARAGIVWNGSGERMHDAALWALLPTLGRTDGSDALGRTWAQATRLDAAIQRALPPPDGIPEAFRRAGLLGMVRVDTLSPTDSPRLRRLWNVPGGAAWEELDFDGPDTLPESPALDAHTPRFLDLRRPEEGQALYRRSTLLTVRLRYLYELRVPFANWILFTAWYASNAGRTLSGAIDRPRLRGGTATSGGQALDALSHAGRGLTAEHGLPPLTPEEMNVLWRLSKGEVALGPGGPARRFFLPLTATSTLRMQSAFHRKWLMHGADGER